MGSFTNWPDGVTSLGVPIVGSGVPIAPRYWWVSSTTGSAGYDGSYDTPYALLSTAISAATAGDVIVLKASHAETISAAGGVTVSKAGLQIIGLGTGATRPTFTFSATASTFIISAASVTVSNIIGTGSIDAVVSPFSITAASATLGLPGALVEWIDPSSSLQAVRVVLTNASADNLRITLKVNGIISGGTSPVNAVRLVGNDNVLINADFYGRASTGWIEFITTLSSNVEIYGYMYNSGVTDASKDVINTGGLSATWFASFYDGSAGYQVSGGSAAALAADDVATVAAGVTTVAANQTVPSADSTANVLERDTVGSKTDTSNPVIGATSSLMRYLKGLMNSTDRTIVKTDGAVLTGADPIFTITGGPIKIVSIVGRVTTIIGGSSNGNIEATTTVPASTTAMSTTVAVDNDAAGTVYTFVGPSGVLTPTTAGVVLMDYGSVTLTPTQYIVNPGTINFTGSAAQSGVIEWTMHYVPMSPSAVVTAAA